MTTVTKDQVKAETQCTTCLSYFDLGETVAKINCKHVFHRDCLVPWLMLHDNWLVGYAI
jgi:E3 ubiquitin-protein ligase RNF115/126